MHTLWWRWYACFLGLYNLLYQFIFQALHHKHDLVRVFLVCFFFFFLLFFRKSYDKNITGLLWLGLINDEGLGYEVRHFTLSPAVADSDLSKRLKYADLFQNKQFKYRFSTFCLRQSGSASESVGKQPYIFWTRKRPSFRCVPGDLSGPGGREHFGGRTVWHTPKPPQPPFQRWGR